MTAPWPTRGEWIRIRQDVGELARGLRIEAGLTADEVARRGYVDLRVVQTVELGSARLRPESLYRVGRGIGGKERGDVVAAELLEAGLPILTELPHQYEHLFAEDGEADKRAASTTRDRKPLNRTAPTVPYVQDPTIADDAVDLMKRTWALANRHRALTELLEIEAGEGQDITDEAFERSGADLSFRAIHLAQSVLGGVTGSADVRPEQMAPELAELWPTMDADLGLEVTS